jgi:hypothetical protein
MFVKQSQVFVSKIAGKKIKVTHVVRSATGDHRFDVCRVAELSTVFGTRVLPGTAKFIYADSIRRKYRKV